MDIDDPIWEDVGIKDEEVALPWLCDENVRKGIRLVLQLDRCKEKECRLYAERASMQEWFREKWECTSRTLSSTGE